jgi:cytochrome c oxidase assembly protein subunit 15
MRMAPPACAAMNAARLAIVRDPLVGIAASGALITLVIVVASAYLRLVHIGLGCEPWPACYGTPALAPDSGQVVALRVVHRLAASSVAVLAFLALAFAWPRRARDPSQLAAALALTALTLLLAGLGLAAGRSVAPAVAVVNVGGGLAMLALFTALAVGCVLHGRWRSPLAYAGAMLLAAAVVLGVLTSATLSGAACPGLMRCDAVSAFSATAAGTERTWLHMGHRAAGLAAAVALAVAAAVAWRRGGRARLAAGALLVLLAIEVLLGFALVGLALPLAAAVAHSAVAALVVGAAVACGCYCRSSDDDAVSALCHMRTSNQPPGSYTQR